MLQNNTFFTEHLWTTASGCSEAAISSIFYHYLVWIFHFQKNKYSSNFKIFNFTVLLHFIQVQLIHQKQPPEVFYKKGVFRNFAKFTGKHLCQSFFFNKVADVKPKNTFFIEHLWTTVSDPSQASKNSGLRMTWFLGNEQNQQVQYWKLRRGQHETSWKIY